MLRRVPLLALLCLSAVGCVTAEASRPAPDSGDRGRLASTDPLATESRAAVADAAGAVLDESHGRWDDARDGWDRVLVRDPDDVDAVLGFARACHARGTPLAALDLLASAARRHPRDARVAHTLGLTYLSSGAPDEALPWLRQAVAVAPDDVRVLGDLLAAQLHLGRTDDALRDARAVPPRRLPSALRLTLGRIALTRDDPDWAARALAAHLDEHPTDAAAWTDLGRAHLLVGATSSAVSALSHAATLDGGRMETSVLLGHAWLASGDAVAALLHYRAAVAAGAPVADLAALMLRAQAMQRARQASGQSATEASAPADLPEDGAS